MKVVNLMKHDCTIALAGYTTTYPPSGTVATVEEKITPNGDRFLENKVEAYESGLQVPIVKREFGEVQGLPEPQPGILYLVSSMVLAAVPDRKDVFAPDSGQSATRNEKGHVVAISRLIGN